MSDAPKTSGTKEDSAPEKSRDEVLAERIDHLRSEIEKAEAEIRILQGRFKNRNPLMAKALQTENTELKKRLKRLQTAFAGLITDSLRPRGPEEARTQHESLKEAAIAYFMKTNVEESLWKNIES